MEITAELAADRVSIKLPQHFDRHAQAAFRQTYADAMTAPEAKVIEVDFAGVDYIDSSALGCLLLLHDRAEKTARSVVLTNCRPGVMKIMNMAQFHRIFDIH